MPHAPATALDSPTQRPSKPRIHFGVALVMTAAVMVGFWPTYFSPLLRGAASLPLVFHLHGAIFTGWMALLMTQVALVAAGRTAAHRKLGIFGMFYGIAVFIMGLVVSFTAPILHINAGESDLNQAAGFLIIPLGDMVLFGGFFGAAVWHRRKPEIHKRLMLLATQGLLLAAFGRMTFLPREPLPLVWLSPLILAVAYEGITRRRVHPVYVIGLVIFVIGSARVLLTESEAWLRIGRTLLRPLLVQ